MNFALFLRKIDVDLGPGYSTSMVQLKMRKMIESETPEKPFSDGTMSQALRGKEIRVVRRTVTKHREDIHIPLSTRRRKRSDATHKGHSR